MGYGVSMSFDARYSCYMVNQELNALRIETKCYGILSLNEF